jgi:hypothetical protein
MRQRRQELGKWPPPIDLQRLTMILTMRTVIMRNSLLQSSSVAKPRQYQLRRHGLRQVVRDPTPVRPGPNTAVLQLRSDGSRTPSGWHAAELTRQQMVHVARIVQSVNVSRRSRAARCHAAASTERSLTKHNTQQMVAFTGRPWFSIGCRNNGAIARGFQDACRYDNEGAQP